MCRRTEEEVGPTVGLPRNRQFVEFFNVPVLAPTRDQPFYTVIPILLTKIHHFKVGLNLQYGLYVCFRY